MNGLRPSVLGTLVDDDKFADGTARILVQRGKVPPLKQYSATLVQRRGLHIISAMCNLSISPTQLGVFHATVCDQTVAGTATAAGHLATQRGNLMR